MAKITRYNGNLKAFAADYVNQKRMVFGTTTASDDLTTNINADFLKGWGIISETNDFPTIQDMNAMGFTLGQLIAYLHQMGMPEWNAAQEYHTNSFVNRSGVIYKCLTDSHVSATAPESDATNWIALPASGISYDNSTSGLAAETVQGAIDEIEGRVDQATATTLGTVELATDAEAQAGTDAIRALTPATLRSGLNVTGSAPIYPCRVWANYTVTASTPALDGAGNVSSVTDNGVGITTLNFTTALASTSYAVIAEQDWFSTDGGIHYDNKATTSVRITTISLGNPADMANVGVAIFQ